MQKTMQRKKTEQKQIDRQTKKGKKKYKNKICTSKVNGTIT